MADIDILSRRYLNRLAGEQLSKLVLEEIGRSRARVLELQRAYPSAERRELVRRLVDAKKALAGSAGAVGGLFGLLSVPLELVLVLYLQLSLVIDVAVLHRINLRSARSQSELLDILAHANGVGPLVRATPQVFGRLASAMFQRGGLKTLGRAVPIVAAPISAWLNAKALERAGREAMLHFARIER